MVTRVVGTESHEKVKEFIVAKLRELRWNVELDEFVDDTPLFKDLKFTNIVATLNPKAERFLLLACHYDSKYFENEEFLGATDSAVPCAMLINLAYVMSSYFQQIKSKDDVSIKLVFFDGEEAFKTWTATDSIYGARLESILSPFGAFFNSNLHLQALGGEVGGRELPAPDRHAGAFGLARLARSDVLQLLQRNGKLVRAAGADGGEAGQA